MNELATPEGEEWQYLARYHVTEVAVDDPAFPVRYRVQCRCGWTSAWHDSGLTSPKILIAEGNKHLPCVEPA